MTTTHSEPEHTLQPGDHGRLASTLLAALPHLLISSTFFGVSVSFGGRGMPWYPYLLVVVLVFALLFAIWRRFPLWSGSWLGYGLLPIGAGLTALIVNATGGDRLLGAIIILLTLCALIAIHYPLQALLASLPLLSLVPRIFIFEELQGGNLIFGGIFVLLAIISSIIVWRRSMRATIIATILFHLLTGAAYTAGHFFLPHSGPLSAGMEATLRTHPTIAELVDHFAPITFATIAVSLALLLVPAIWRVIRPPLRPQAAN